MQVTATNPLKGNTARRAGAGCGILFSLHFLIIGIWVLLAYTPSVGTPFTRYAPKAFGMMFVVSGIAMSMATLSRMRELKQEAALITAAPAQPWRWRQDWAGNRCQDRLARKVASIWVFGITWTLLSSSTLPVIPDALARGQKFMLLLVLFPLVGIGMLAVATYQTIRAMRFGPSLLELSSNPYIPGRTASGTVRVKMREVPEKGFTATLQQIRAVTTGSGKNRRTRETVEWQQATHVARGAVMPSPELLRIPVRFEIPENAQETDDSNVNDRRLWRLDITADMAGVDYAASFEVPVYRGDVSSALG